MRLGNGLLTRGLLTGASAQGVSSEGQVCDCPTICRVSGEPWAPVCSALGQLAIGEHLPLQTFLSLLSPAGGECSDFSIMFDVNYKTSLSMSPEICDSFLKYDALP